MTKSGIPCLLVMLILSACNNQETTKVELTETGQKFSTFEKFISSYSEDTSGPLIIEKGKKPQKFVNEDLPKSYVQRTFVKGLSTSTYDIFLVPGNIVKFDTVTKDYERKTLVALIKNNRIPTNEVIQDGIIYSNKINKGASFNGSFVIGSLSVSDNQILELVVQDVTKSYVPDSLIDVTLVKKIADKIPANERQYYYFVKNAILTLVNNRKFRETKLETKINTTYVTAEGKVYNSNDKFARERIVSVELVSLNGLLTPSN